MEVLVENIVTYGFAFLLVGGIIFFYLRSTTKKSKVVEEKILKAKTLGFYEPMSLHPVVDPEICIGSGACIEACPEKDILGIMNGKATTINASRCVGHGACFHACPVQAITLVMGTEKRGVELPHVSETFESNVDGLYITGELGGMGLVKNAVEQGKQAIENITKRLQKRTYPTAQVDVLIVGAGPAGISATLTAKKNNLKFVTLEQDSLGGTVYNFPRKKMVMTAPLELPLYGKLNTTEISKSRLLDLWTEVLLKNNITINEQERVLEIQKKGDCFEVTTNKKTYISAFIVLAIGRRGSPRKLGVKGEEKDKVFYRLIEPELVQYQHILVVGGGDSALEAALALAEEEGNTITLSYRGESFGRVKPANFERIKNAEAQKKIRILLTSNVKEIFDDKVLLTIHGSAEGEELRNDIVYVFAGGELPTAFLEKICIHITKKFGETVLKH